MAVREGTVYMRRLRRKHGCEYPDPKSIWCDRMATFSVIEGGLGSLGYYCDEHAQGWGHPAGEQREGGDSE